MDRFNTARAAVGVGFYGDTDQLSPEAREELKKIAEAEHLKRVEKDRQYSQFRHTFYVFNRLAVAHTEQGFNALWERAEAMTGFLTKKLDAEAQDSSEALSLLREDRY